jgi:hypothetical protein
MTSPETLTDQIIADAYRSFKDYYSSHYYFSTFPSYQDLDSDTITFWNEFTKSLLHRCTVEANYKRTAKIAPAQ